MFNTYIKQWGLVPDGAPILTRSSRLLPVLQQGTPAMIKIAVEAEERKGASVMEWWAGDGAAKVLARDGYTLLLERATGTRSLADMVLAGEDAAATEIICAAVTQLHQPRNKPLPELVPLDRWFRELRPGAAAHGGILHASLAAADMLLSTAAAPVVLHGDVHHGNFLHFGERGWLAIDPKGLLGERGFDFANIFCNPEYEIAVHPGRLQQQVQVVCRIAGMEQQRLLQWILAWAGLSAVWSLQDSDDPDTALEVAAIAAAALQA